MDIVEEVVRRRQTFAIQDPGSVYPEIRDLMERRMSFDGVTEDKYYHDIDTGVIRSNLTTVEWFDDGKTKEELEIYIFISKESRELDIQVKGKLVTSYPTDGWRGTLWYYAYTALYDKFLYGEVRHGWEHAVEEKVEEFFERLRSTVEVK